MNIILIPSFQIEEFTKQIQLLAKSFFKTKYMDIFIKNNGIVLFPDIIQGIYMPTPCCFCNSDSIDQHKEHENQYAIGLLNRILEPNWYQEIYCKYFLNHYDEMFFIKWLESYIRYNFKKIIF
jgi:hypothetical protein